MPMCYANFDNLGKRLPHRAIKKEEETRKEVICLAKENGTRNYT